MARSAGKIDRRNLRQPDEFMTRSAKLIEYVQVNKKKVSLIAGGILLVLIVSFAYRIYQNAQEVRASSLVAMAMEKFSKDPKNSVPFEQIVRGYSGTNGARIARLYFAHTLYRKGEVERAAEAYQKLIVGSTVPEFLHTQAVLGRGYSLVTLKRCKEAEKTFKMERAKASFTQQQAQLAIGHCYELKGDSREAIKHFREFAGRFPQSPFLTESLQRKIRLNK